MPRSAELMIEAEALAIHQLSGNRFGWRWHQHPGWELFAVRCGAGQALIGDHVGDFRAGDVFLLGPRLAHCFWSPGGERELDTLYLHADAALLTPLARLPGAERLRRLLSGGGRGWRYRGAAAAAIATDTARWRPREPIWYAAFCAALVRLAASDEGTELAASPPSMRSDHGLVEQLLAVIAERYAEPLSISAIAEAAGTHRSTACAALRAATGRTVMELVREARLAEACRLLASTSLPAAVIARRVGWSDGPAFARAFREAFRDSPGRWRRRR